MTADEKEKVEKVLGLHGNQIEVNTTNIHVLAEQVRKQAEQVETLTKTLAAVCRILERAGSATSAAAGRGSGAN